MDEKELIKWFTKQPKEKLQLLTGKKITDYITILDGVGFVDAILSYFKQTVPKDNKARINRYNEQVKQNINFLKKAHELLLQ